MKNRVEIEHRLSGRRRAKESADDLLEAFPNDSRRWIESARINSEIECLEWVLDNEL